MMRKKQIQSISFVALLALMLILMGMVFLPYISVLLWSAVAYILISPVYLRLERGISRQRHFIVAKRYLLAGVFAVGTVLLMAGVVFFVGFQLIGQGKIFLEESKAYLEQNPMFFSETTVGSTIAAAVKQISLGTVNLSSIDIRAEAMGFLSSYSATIGSMARGLAKNIGNFFLSLVFMCFALYFFFLDGTYLANLFIRAIPIDKDNMRSLLHKFRDVTTNLFKGFFLVALYQASAAFILFFAFGIKGSLLFAVLILFSSFIPMLGCAIVWMPLGVSVIVRSGMGTGIAFMVLCAVFISFLDNFMRPLFLKDRIKIHPLLIFFSILGGLKVFGFNGIILGPLVIILFFTIVDMALEDGDGSISSHAVEKIPEDDSPDGAAE